MIPLRIGIVHGGLGGNNHHHAFQAAVQNDRNPLEHVHFIHVLFN